MKLNAVTGSLIFAAALISCGSPAPSAPAIEVAAPDVLMAQAALVPGVDWSSEALIAYFESADPWGLEPCTIEVERARGGWRVRLGTVWGFVATSQRLIGCVPGSRAPIFQ